MENLPPELQEFLLSYLNGDTLLIASRVSKQWNLMISSHQRVWRKKCEDIGTGSLNANTGSWKDLFITSRHKLQSLKKGCAFQHACFIPNALRGSYIRGLAYSHGHIFAGNHYNICVWNAVDFKILGTFRVPYKLSCLTNSEDGCILGIGQNTGRITTFQLDFEERFHVRGKNEFLGHSSSVTSLSILLKKQLLFSGSTDGSVRLWNMSSADLLWTLRLFNTVLQVALISEQINAVIFADEHNIRWCTWSHDIDEMQEVESHISSHQGKFVVEGYRLVCCKNDCIMVFDWLSGKRLSFFPLQNIDIQHKHQLLLQTVGVEIIAVGTRFLLAALWDTICQEFKIVTLDILKRRVIGQYSLPLPDIIVSGSNTWLNGLGCRNQHDELVFVAFYTNQALGYLRLVVWRNDQM